MSTEQAFAGFGCTLQTGDVPADARRVGLTGQVLKLVAAEAKLQPGQVRALRVVLPPAQRAAFLQAVEQIDQLGDARALLPLLKAAP